MIVYTHHSGIEIHVSDTHQMVDLGGIFVGPFEPLEVDETCAIIAQEAGRTSNFALLSAASDWRILNEGAELSADESEDKSYGWHW